MSPTQFHESHNNNAKIRGNNSSNNIGLCPPALKINKESQLIRKSTSSTSRSSSSSSSSPSSMGVTGPTKPRHPVIIYTHSPKIIHTHPKDFMALVQKLTGLSRSSSSSDDEKKLQGEKGIIMEEESTLKKRGNIVNKDNENESSTSVITEESYGDHVSQSQGQVLNSCFVGPPFFDPSSNYLTNIPVFTPNPADHFLCANHSTQPFYNYADSLFFAPNMRTNSLSSSSSALALEGINDFRDY